MSVEGTTSGVPGALRAGSTFGGFRIERTLGHGGMGIVYLATELRLERQVALKVIRAELATDQDFRARFRSEQLTAASVEHPRVVTIFGAGDMTASCTCRCATCRAAISGGWSRRTVRFHRRTPRELIAQVAAGSMPCTPPGSCTATSSPCTT